MILACKSHVTNGGRDTVWTQPTTLVLDKLNSCLRLYDVYGTNYRAVKRLLEEVDDERKFDFSETLIFGKFEKLARRIRNITDLFNTIATYSRLREFKFDIGNCQLFLVSLCFYVLLGVGVS
jgi:Dynein heavy chain, N-terminal region 1